MAQKPEKAYKNLDFLNSSDARLLRILAEFLEPHARFRRHKVEDTIVFFGSARSTDVETAEKQYQLSCRTLEKDATPQKERQKRLAEKRLQMAQYYEDARELSRRLTIWSQGLDRQKGRFLVTSGGGPGIMEAANRGASEAPDGRSVGLNISIPMEQDCNPFISDELNFEFHYFFTRKFWFIYLAKAVVVFPGGFGTMDELFEVLTLLQTGKVKKDIPVVLYGSDFWHEILNFDALVANQVINRSDLDLIHFADSVDDAFGYLTERLLSNGRANKR